MLGAEAFWLVSLGSGKDLLSRGGLGQVSTVILRDLGLCYMLHFVMSVVSRVGVSSGRWLIAMNEGAPFLGVHLLFHQSVAPQGLVLSLLHPQARRG